MIIECAELISENNDRISIGGCFIGDTVEQATECLGNYEGPDKIADGVLQSWLDVDLMWPRHVLKNLFDAKINCYYEPEAGDGVKSLTIEGDNLSRYPYIVVAEIEQKIDTIVRNSSFTYTTPELNPDFPVNYISIESPYCELEFIWRKKFHHKNKTFEILVGRNSKDLLGTPYDKKFLLGRVKRKIAMRLSKYDDELTEAEIKEEALNYGLKETDL